MDYLTKSEEKNEAALNTPIPDEEFELLDEHEKNSSSEETASRRYIRDVWSRFKKNKLSLVSLGFLAAVILLAVFVPVISPYAYDEMDTAHVNALPGILHWLGTDKFGRDIFVRLMSGARISLLVGFAAAVMSLVIGVAYGSICGYMGGKIDMILMRVVDIVYSIPTLLYVIMLMLILGPNTLSVLIAIGISSWVGMARLVRGQIMKLKEQEYVRAAVVSGAGRARIIFRHLIVNCLGQIIVEATLIVPTAIFTEAFLAFAGIGISIPQASLGAMANEARSLLYTHPLQMLWPIMAICLSMLALNFIGDGLSEALDPGKH